ncbi:MAG: LexA-related transcriptional regulator [Chlorobi bacterium]|nr:LexA-related transcriptional regulator [Chlorobiota bacterium]
MSTLGERVRQLRLRHRLSQQEFAENLGISQSFLSDIERDTKIPGGDTLLSLKRSYGISIDWLLGGELEIFEEGARVDNTGKSRMIVPLTVASGDDRVMVLETKVAEMEREILTLRGQISAYKEILTTLKSN